MRGPVEISHGTQSLRLRRQPLAASRSTTEFYNADGLGSITSLGTSAGALSDSFAYDAFGNLGSSTGSFAQSFRYTGREWDSEAGLYYYRARYYDPTIGRFISEDPIRFTAGIDFYTYAGDNPVAYSDPTGLKTCCRGEEKALVNRADKARKILDQLR